MSSDKIATPPVLTLYENFLPLRDQLDFENTLLAEADKLGDGNGEIDQNEGHLLLTDPELRAKLDDFVATQMAPVDGEAFISKLNAIFRTSASTASVSFHYKPWDMAPETYTCDYLDGDSYEGQAQIEFQEIWQGKDKVGLSLSLHLHPNFRDGIPGFDPFGKPLKGEFYIDVYDDGRMDMYDAAGDRIDTTPQTVNQLARIFGGTDRGTYSHNDHFYRLKGHVSNAIEGHHQPLSDDTWTNALGAEKGSSVQNLMDQVSQRLEVSVVSRDMPE